MRKKRPDTDRFDTDRLGRDPKMAGLFHDDPTLDAAIRTLRRLPEENELAIDRILSAVRAEQTVEVIPNVLATTRRRSYWGRGTVAAVAAAALFGIGFVTGNWNSVAPTTENMAAENIAAADHAGSTVDMVDGSAGQDMWIHSNGAPSSVTGQLASQGAQGANVVRESIPVATQFFLAANQAKEVSLVGDFNGWDPAVTPLRKMADGSWVVTALLRPGHHTYAYMIDGVITPDPRAVNVRDRDYDVIVSTIVVKGAE